ncbi:UVR8 [Scenedesmus sp. PABB004]|nr:UVR8 [Scenedesmus sp. PABB004]
MERATRSSAAASGAPRRSQRIASRRASAAAAGAAGAAGAAAAGAPPGPAAPRGRKRNGARAARPAAALAKRARADEPRASGLLDLLPLHILDAVLELCTARQLAMLETTCAFFRRGRMLENIAEARLKAVPRAKGMEPNPKAFEKYASLLNFVLAQSAAAAQATAIAFGSSHTAALLISKLDGNTGHHSLYTFGRGFYGQLGHGDYLPQREPKQLCIGYQTSVEQPEMEEEITPAVVACGDEYSTSITRRGQLLTWGLGSRGELGHELPAAGEVPYPMRSLLSTRPAVRIVSVACGSHHTLAISVRAAARAARCGAAPHLTCCRRRRRRRRQELGCVWSCGRNGDGQLGNSTLADAMQLQPVVGINRNHRIVSCAAGVSHSLALASDGSLYTWGSGRYGQLGHVNLQAVHLMVPAQALVLTTPQRIGALDPVMLKPWRRVTSIAAGGHHSCAVTVGGSMLMFGRNKHGQLGMGDNENRWRPTEVTMSATEPSDNFRSVQVVCGLQHTLALIAHFGKIQPFASGAGRVPPAWSRCPGRAAAAAAPAGGRSRRRRAARAGANVFGQLGLGHQVAAARFAPVPKLRDAQVVALQAGNHSSGAVCEDGTVFLWGRNDRGQLGLGGNTGRWAPARLAGFKAVHPDKTLRKSKRTAPRMRPAAPAVPPAASAPNNRIKVLFAKQEAAAVGQGGGKGAAPFVEAAAAEAPRWARWAAAAAVLLAGLAALRCAAWLAGGALAPRGARAPARPAPATRPLHPGSARDHLLLYVFSPTDPEFLENLRFFVSEAVARDTLADHVIIVQTGDDLERVALPELPPHAKYVYHANECYDWGTYGWLLLSSGYVDVARYKFFFFVNSSVRGPFLPAYARGRMHWMSAFTSRLSGSVKLVGSTISCEGSPLHGQQRGRWRRNPHVQSYAVATDRAGLDLLIADRRVFACHRDRWDTIFYSELGSSKAVLDAGFNLGCLMLRYQGVDWRDRANWDCNARLTPTSEYSCDGTSLDPLEVLFVKVKSYMLASDISFSKKATRYQAWQAQSDAWAAAPAGGGRNFSALSRNEYLDQLHRHKAPRVLEARARGAGCFDFDYYAKENPDLRALWGDATGLWRHYVYYGQFAARPHRWTCAVNWTRIAHWPA